MTTAPTKAKKTAPIAGEHDRQTVLDRYRLCCMSRECSVLARREVLTGKAKFGIIGDGKELPQIALASVFQKGDWRSGYYRDQTILFALGLMPVELFFAQLYADPAHDEFTGGRSMNGHYVTPTIDKKTGNWLNHNELHNISADVSPTAGQMARGLGLAFASKKYRESTALADSTGFSKNGNEVCFVTIGDASTSEGVFWETMNAAGVLRVPMVVSVWDDGYGISVPKKYQTAKQSISEALSGLQFDEELGGVEIYKVKAWDYPALLETYQKAADRARKHHIPALVHVEEVTQQLGHSTSGDHRRYKSDERLQFEKDFDCNARFADWIFENGLASREELAAIEKEGVAEARRGQSEAYRRSMLPGQKAHSEAISLLKDAAADFPGLAERLSELEGLRGPMAYESVKIVRQAFQVLPKNGAASRAAIENWLGEKTADAHRIFSTELYSESEKSALKVPVEPPVFSESSTERPAYEVINAFFDLKLAENPAVFAFGEDVGKIGDVNQGFMGMQAKHGKSRVFDTGIREWTIMGQALGMAMRGLRPIAEIQYLDYLLYGLSPLSDDLACLRWRTAGQQIAPAIIRTRGHRLEGIWHAGSPMGMVLGSLRGMWVCVPRNLVQAAGMYNTLLRSDDPALVVECLNGYRLKERQPDNLSTFTVPLGRPEVLRAGTDATLVTYGSCVRVAAEACERLEAAGISVELIDCQTLLPFDLDSMIVESLKKTSRLAVLDEDFPGGASAFILQNILEKQGGYRWLDAAPRSITAVEHRSPYGSDGDYWAKPNAEDVFDAMTELMAE